MEFFPPGPQKSMFLGNAPQFQHEPLQFMMNSARAYGDIVHFRFGPSHAYLLTNPAYAHYILVERTDKFAENPHLLRALNSAFGHELSAPPETVKKAVRRQPLFQPAWLDDYADDIARDAADMVAGWAGDEPREMVSELKRLTLRIVARTLLNTTATDAAARMGEAMFFSPMLADRRFQSPLTLPGWVPTPGNRRQQQADAELNSLIAQMIDNCRANADECDGLLARLIAESDRRVGSRVGDATVRDEAVALFLAGHETSAHTLAWAFYLLSQNPDAEALLHDELDAVLGGRLPTADDLPNLVYAEQVIRETLRLYPPAWLISRQARTEVKIANYYLPSGSTIFISPYIMHHSARYFADPEAFIPERFSEGYDRRMPRHAYIPFGAGARASLEQSVTLTQSKLILATVAQARRLALEPGQMVTPNPQLTMQPKDGLKMRVQARDLAPMLDTVG